MNQSTADAIQKDPLAFDAYDFRPDRSADAAMDSRPGSVVASTERTLEIPPSERRRDEAEGQTGLGTRPTFTILGGRASSGKAWFKGRVFNADAAIVLDCDEIMASLPDYEGWNAPTVRNEAADLLEVILERARAEGMNVVVDATLNSAEGAISKIDAFRAAGYRVEIHYMYVPRQLAAKRVIERFNATNHYVPIESVLANTSNEKTFDLVRGRADAWTFYDNSGEEPVLVAAGPDGDMPAR
jgi:predicted ABC-type ATPase